MTRAGIVLLTTLGAALAALPATAQGMAPRNMMGGGQISVGPQFGFFQANQPSSSNRVGVFVARKEGGVTTLYYCSSPVDANSNEPNGCKPLKGFPGK